MEPTYDGMSDFQIKGEYQKIFKQVKSGQVSPDGPELQGIMVELEKRGISVPRTEAPPESAFDDMEGVYTGSDASSGPNFVRAGLGAIIMIIGIALTMSSDGTIYYGAILVGLVMLVGGLVSG